MVREHHQLSRGLCRAPHLPLHPYLCIPLTPPRPSLCPKALCLMGLNSRRHSPSYSRQSLFEVTACSPGSPTFSPSLSSLQTQDPGLSRLPLVSLCTQASPQACPLSCQCRSGTAAPLPPVQAVVLKHRGPVTCSSCSPLPDGALSPQPLAGSLGSSESPSSPLPSLNLLSWPMHSILTRRSLTSFSCLRTFQSFPYSWNEPTPTLWSTRPSDSTRVTPRPHFPPLPAWQFPRQHPSSLLSPGPAGL